MTKAGVTRFVNRLDLAARGKDRRHRRPPRRRTPDQTRARPPHVPRPPVRSRRAITAARPAAATHRRGLPAHPRPGSLPWSVASGSVPSSPTSAAISASRRAIRYGENCTSPSTNTAAIGSAWSGEARSRLPDRPHRRPAQSPARRPARTGRHGPASRHPRLAHRHRPQTAKGARQARTTLARSAPFVTTDAWAEAYRADGPSDVGIEDAY